MQKWGKVNIIYFIVLSFLLIYGEKDVLDAADIQLTDETYISFTGYLETLGGYRTGSDHKGDIAAFRNTFRPEFLYQFSKDARLFVSGYFVEEPSYSMEEEADIPGDYYDRTDFEAWELYIDARLSSNTFVRAGRQFVVWGETDIYRLLDITNPQDSSWMAPGIMPMEDTRIPMWMLKLTQGFGFDTNLEIVWLPLLNDEDERVNKGAPSGGRWAANPPPSENLFSHFPTLASQYAAAAAAGATLDSSGLMQPNIPKDDLDESRYGARLRTSIWGADVSFIAYYGHDLSPVIQYNGFDLQTRHELIDDGTGNAVYQDVDYFVPDLALEYHRQGVFGFAFNYYDDVFTKAVLRGEFAYLPDKHYNTVEPNNSSGVTEKDTLAYALGYDKEIMIPALHPDDPSMPFFLSCQMFQQIVFNHDNDLRLAIYDTKIHELDTNFTIGFSTPYFHNTIKPEIAGVLNPCSNTHGMVRFRCTFNPPWDENYYFQFTYINFLGESEYEGNGLFEDKDTAFLRIRYMF